MLSLGIHIHQNTLWVRNPTRGDLLSWVPYTPLSWTLLSRHMSVLLGHSYAQKQRFQVLTLDPEKL